MKTRCLIDTNILAYPYDRDEAAKASRAMDIRRQLNAAEAGVISTQVVCELYNALTKSLKRRLSREDALEAVALEYDSWPIFSITPAVAFSALEIASRHKLSIWDAQIVATAVEYGIPWVLSEDFARGSEIEGVLIQDPFAMEFGDSELGVLLADNGRSV